MLLLTPPLSGMLFAVCYFVMVFCPLPHGEHFLSYLFQNIHPYPSCLARSIALALAMTSSPPLVASPTRPTKSTQLQTTTHTRTYQKKRAPPPGLPDTTD